jgi:hypothetical protein
MQATAVDVATKVMALEVLAEAVIFVQGESSGSAGSGSNGNWDNANDAYQRGGNFTSNNTRYGGNQQRWSTGRGGALVN